MKIILNKDGNVTVDVEDYNQEEIAEMIERLFNNHGIKDVELCIE